jgi:hypothetical protein
MGVGLLHFSISFSEVFGPRSLVVGWHLEHVAY